MAAQRRIPVERTGNSTLASPSGRRPRILCTVQSLYYAHVLGDPESETLDEITDVVLLASRALVGVAARSIAAVADDVTIPQFRALVVLASRGPQNLGSLADALGVHTSSATRLCDRLVARKLIRRVTATDDRREITLSLAPRGRDLVADVTVRRRDEITAIVARVPESAARRWSRASGRSPMPPARCPTRPGRRDGRRHDALADPAHRSRPSPDGRG